MEANMYLTVQEALQRPTLQSAVVLAGREGLHRRIRWVHILETTDFEALIHGNEMILTTGIGFHSAGTISPDAFLNKLIAKNASCLCIEIGVYFDNVSASLIETANEHHFPLILFSSTVRFVDITQDLHSLIINRHHRMLQELESVSREFQRLTLSPQGTHNVLKLLQKRTQAQIVYRPFQGQPTFIPSAAPEEQKRWIDALEARELSQEAASGAAAKHWRFGGSYVLSQSIGALGQTWAQIALMFDQEPQEYDHLMMDSASLSIAQELLRKRYTEERKLYTENLWIDDLLNERLRDAERIKAAVGPSFKKWNESNFRVCVIEFANGDASPAAAQENDRDSAYFHLSLILRASFERFSFHPLITLKNNRMVVIAFDLRASAPEQSRMRQALDAVHAGTKEKIGGLALSIGVSNRNSALTNAVTSYHEASRALALYPIFKQPSMYYENLGVFQLLHGLSDTETLHSYIRAHLGPVIEHDRTKGSDLLYTLKVLLENEGSKQVAAQKLFIVRQSLYYRLDKIGELIGEDFLSTEKRLSIEVALRAYQMMHPELFAEPPSRSS